MQKLIWSNDTNSYMRQLQFSDILPGQHFAVAENSQYTEHKYIRIYGDIQYNAVNMYTGNICKFSHDEIVYVELT